MTVIHTQELNWFAPRRSDHGIIKTMFTPMVSLTVDSFAAIKRYIIMSPQLMALVFIITVSTLWPCNFTCSKCFISFSTIYSYKDNHTLFSVPLQHVYLHSIFICFMEMEHSHSESISELVKVTSRLYLSISSAKKFSRCIWCLYSSLNCQIKPTPIHWYIFIHSRPYVARMFAILLSDY